MKQELISSSINQYMVGFVHSLHMQIDLNPKKKVYPFSGDGVFLSPTVYICAMAMTFLFRMLQGFFKYGLRRDLCIPDTMSNEDCQQYVMDYFKVMYHYNVTYHTRHSVLENYATWFNGGRESYMVALAKTKQGAILIDSMCDIHGWHLTRQLS